MTEELAQIFFDGFQSDPTTFADGTKFRPFVYSEKWVSEYLNKQASLNHVLLAIMLGDTPIGEVKFHNISKKRRECDLSVSLKNDSYRNHGYGTEGILLAVEYAIDVIGIDRIYAQVALRNERAQRVLKNLGFTEDYREYGYVRFENDLTKIEGKKSIELVPMTRELYHEFYRGYRTDLPPKGLRYNYHPYVYNEETEEEYYRLSVALERIMFAVIIDGSPVGEVILQSVNYDRKDCKIRCTMQSKEYKNRGYGKEAIKLALNYAKNTLNLTKVIAHVESDNTHARHVLEKIGFKRTENTGSNMIYEITL